MNVDSAPATAHGCGVGKSHRIVDRARDGRMRIPRRAATGRRVARTAGARAGIRRPLPPPARAGGRRGSDDGRLRLARSPVPRAAT